MPREASRTAGRARRRHARHQGRGTALHPRHRSPAAGCARGSSTSRRAGKPRPAMSPPQEIALNHPRGGSARVRPGSRRLGDRDGGGLRQLDAAPERRRRHDLGRRLGRHLAGGAGACARCRSACPSSSISSVASGDVAPYVGPADITHDVFGHRRAGPELDLAPGARQRRATPSSAW